MPSLPTPYRLALAAHAARLSDPSAQRLMAKLQRLFDAHRTRLATRGLWPVEVTRDGEIVSFAWLATPIAQSMLDASRAGTLRVTL